MRWMNTTKSLRNQIHQSSRINSYEEEKADRFESNLKNQIGIDKFMKYRNNNDSEFTPPDEISDYEKALETHMQTLNQADDCPKSSPDFCVNNKQFDMSFVKSDEEHKNSSEIENYKEKETDVNISDSLDNSALKNKLFDSKLFSPIRSNQKKNPRFSELKNKVSLLRSGLLKSKTDPFNLHERDKNIFGRNSSIPWHRIHLNLDGKSEDNWRISESSLSNDISINWSKENDSPNLLDSKLDAITRKNISIPRISTIHEVKSEEFVSSGRNYLTNQSGIPFEAEICRPKTAELK
jgi:hypothetical protein